MSKCSRPNIPILTTMEVDNLYITTEEVMALMDLFYKTDTKKALEPDNISPHVLKWCAVKIATPLTRFYRGGLVFQAWPALWKQARVMSVPKKGSRTYQELQAHLPPVHDGEKPLSSL
ncbi:hypothetical protein E2C01_020236 [Portunus trituberculatus]|uniref:Uncharacterized protein n=1 Tax=Portunus trituberculatus TaxID=210409 RepID=A0A5B7DZE0_PORTR|nr:hypothetical protein [Portunus trituberculatus]